MTDEEIQEMQKQMDEEAKDDAAKNKKNGIPSEGELAQAQLTAQNNPEQSQPQPQLSPPPNSQAPQQSNADEAPYDATIK
jgi:hypothetical protein